MPRTPETADVPKIRLALRFYRTLAWITGLFLILLVVEMVLKYGFGQELSLNGSEGFIALVPSELMSGTNLSLVIQLTHGYIYVVYLVSAFLLVNYMRWKITRFIVIALGGVVPFLSFFVEHRITREVQTQLAALSSGAAPEEAEAAAEAAVAPAPTTTGVDADLLAPDSTP